MSEHDISMLWPDCTVMGVLKECEYSRTYLVQRLADDGTVAYESAREIWIPPNSEAVEKAVSMGIETDRLVSYFEKFKNDLNWEMTLYKAVDSVHMAKNKSVEFLGRGEELGWRGFFRNDLYVSLDKYFARTRTGTQEALRLGLEICQGLETCENFGLVHGEINPENVKLTEHGEFVLVNFGVYRCLEKAGAAIVACGMSDYDAPETAAHGKYTPVSDVYSLGMVMAYLLNGCVLPQGKNLSAIKDADPELLRIIKKATAYDPEERYASASEMRADLTRIKLNARPIRVVNALAAAQEEIISRGGAAAAVTAEAVAQEPAREKKKGPENTKGSRQTRDKKRSIVIIILGMLLIGLALAAILTSDLWMNKGRADYEPGDVTQQVSPPEETPDTSPSPSPTGGTNAAVTPSPSPSPSASPPAASPSPSASPTPTPKPTPKPTPTPTPTPSPSPSPSQEPDDEDNTPVEKTPGYLMPTDTELISLDDLQGLSRDESYMLINEIYARYGKIFKTPSVRQYFEGKDWYVPVTESSSEIERKFSDIEKANIDTLIAYQVSQGYRKG